MGVAISKHLRIVKGGGPITNDVYKAGATATWRAGSLLKLSGGSLVPVKNTSGGAAGVTTADTGASNARLFIALDDHPTASAEFVSVQEILPDTVLELQVCASSSNNHTPANVVKGQTYAAYQLQDTQTPIAQGSGVIGLDRDVTTNGFLNVIDVESNWNPHKVQPSTAYAKVWAKVIRSILA